MGYIKSFIYDFQNTYTEDDRFITLLFASLFLPYYISVIMIVGGMFFVLVRSDFLLSLKRIKGAKTLMLFGGYLLVISLLNQNWLGAVLSVGMLALFVDVIHYQRFIHKDLFEQILDIAIILSVVAVVYAIGEQFYYMSQIDGMGFFDIQNKPAYRVHTFYFNANYYAMMILFIECMCIYKFFVIKSVSFRCYYTIIGVLNLFALYLTGGRIAWLCLALAVLVMLLFNRWYKLCMSAVGGIIAALGVLALKPNLLPRLAAKGLKVERRKQIWQTALLIIQDSYLFGRGPLTYYAVYESYTDAYIAAYGLKSLKQYKLGISSQHAHTMFLEPIVSFGIVGTLILLGYLFVQLKNLVYVLRKVKAYAFVSLVMGVIISTLAFCVMDFPIFWVQSGACFLFVLGSCEMFVRELTI